MSQEYFDPKRESDHFALPDVEIFQGADYNMPHPEGWYWWVCLPGRVPFSEPSGPFDSYADALADAKENPLF